MKGFRTFFNRPAIKSVVNYVFGLATATFASMYFSQLPQKTIWLWGGLFGAALLSEIVLIIAHSKSEAKSNKQNQFTSAAEDLMENLPTCFRTSAESIHELVKNARQTGEIDTRIWNYRRISDFVCTQLYHFIKSIAYKGENFSVNYIIPAPNGKREYFMLSYDGNETDRPNIYMCSISQTKAAPFYFARLFQRNNPAVSYLTTSEEVSAHFYFASENSRGKYSQYIGIPIYCEGNNMLGLLQIVACEGSVIAAERTQLEYIVHRYIMGYADLILFAEKIQSGIAFPSEIK